MPKVDPEKYRLHRGCISESCDSENVETQTPQYLYNGVTILVSCCVCHQDWIEQYTLTSVSTMTRWNSDLVVDQRLLKEEK